MQTLAPHPLLDRIVPVIVAAIIFAPVTYLEVVHPTSQRIGSTISALTLGRVPAQPQSTPSKASPSPTTASGAPGTSASSSTAAQATTTTKTALTNTFVHLRSAKSVGSTIITDLNAGTTVELRSDADATWQGVTYQGKSGYIYRTYLQY